VSFNQVEFCLESWKKEFQPQKDMAILNSTLLISWKKLYFCRRYCWMKFCIKLYPLVTLDGNVQF
jgi:hypothetical protein